ncbi:NADPH-dependent curcumin reductase CurA [Caulobacter ginsengisoli]|uniref:NADPH-dependent curcumin reductase CurA n=1 Tax=Caulobacter ginsengisoli TaxID=400775 RepID=A0ABU0IMZ1_9CAUL|nr:NADP-dependent oxidoreductase [Caulobacter ginsengisoli]MDQ0463388.1 NADPH-dependent curcumin reductase CurA [Caulobacter ginsengisoli]
MSGTTRSWGLRRHVDGAPSPDDFAVAETPLQAVEDGMFLARTIWASVDPGMRSTLSGGDSYSAATPLGAIIDGFSVAEVIESRHPNYAVGDLIATGGGWREHVLSSGRGYFQKIVDRRVPLGCWIGVLGVPGMTAWFGLNRVAQAKEGETLLVTSAAGPVGATAGQIGKKLGMRVVGVAGGPRKCAWLKDEAGFDAVVDYKAESDLTAAIRAACPEGVDVLFDNVGNAMIDRVLPMMKLRGRVVVSGQVADYNTPVEERPGLRHTDVFITHRVRMEGLVVFDDIRGFAAAQSQMADWIAEGSLKFAIETFDGFDKLPEAFCGLFRGENFGRRLVQLSPEPA